MKNLKFGLSNFVYFVFILVTYSWVPFLNIYYFFFACFCMYVSYSDLESSGGPLLNLSLIRFWVVYLVAEPTRVEVKLDVGFESVMELV